MTVHEYIQKLTDGYDGSTIKKLKQTIRQSREDIKKRLKEFSGAGYFNTQEYMKYNRYNKLIDEYNNMLKTLEKNKYTLINNSRIEVYREVFNLNSYQFQEFTGLGISYSDINKEAVLLSIENPIENLKLQEVLKRNRIQSLNALNTLLTNQILAGNAYTETAQQLNNFFNSDLYKMERIVRTENHRVKNVASQLSMEEAAKTHKVTMKKTWLATVDERTREAHMTANGQTVVLNEDFKVGNSKGLRPGMLFGIDSASQNINCRCEVIEEINGNSLEAKWNPTKYKEWKNGN